MSESFLISCETDLAGGALTTSKTFKQELFIILGVHRHK